MESSALVLRGVAPVDGSGDGSGYWALVAQQTKVALAAIRRGASTVAFWRSKSDGTPSNGENSSTAEVGQLQEVPGPLRLCSSHALHATMSPEKWDGDRLWIVALWGKVVYEDDKMGALKREILEEVE